MEGQPLSTHHQIALTPYQITMSLSGSEHTTGNGQKTSICEKCAARCGAFPADLTEVVGAWPTLSPALRSEIVDLVRAAAPIRAEQR